MSFARCWLDLRTPSHPPLGTLCVDAIFVVHLPDSHPPEAVLQSFRFAWTDYLEHNRTDDSDLIVQIPSGTPAQSPMITG
jgi:hypothetical protein